MTQRQLTEDPSAGAGMESDLLHSGQWRSPREGLHAFFVPILPGLLVARGELRLQELLDEVPQDRECDYSREERARADALRDRGQRATILALAEHGAHSHKPLPLLERKLDVLARVRDEDNATQPLDPLRIEGQVTVLCETGNDGALRERGRSRLDRLETTRPGARAHHDATPKSEGDDHLPDLAPWRVRNGQCASDLLDDDRGVVAAHIGDADRVDRVRVQLADLERADNAVLGVVERRDGDHPELPERLLARRGVRGVVRVDLRTLGVQSSGIERLAGDDQPVNVDLVGAGLAGVLEINPALERLTELDGRQDMPLGKCIGTRNMEGMERAHRF